MDQPPASPSPPDRTLGARLFALSFMALFLELLVIRWVPSEVRLVAYYANLMLISSFLGLGVGAMLAERPISLIRWFLPAMGAMVVCIVIFSGHALPTSSGEARFFSESTQHIIGYIVLVLIFLLNTFMFVPIGQEIGRIFGKLPPLIAYSWDLGGSLTGTLIFGAFSIGFFSPLLGFLVAVAIFFAVFPKRIRMIDPAIGVVVILIIAASSNHAAIWSAYHYLTVHDAALGPTAPALTDAEPNHHQRMDPMLYRVRVNQDTYQLHSTINPARYTPGSVQQQMNRVNIVQYPLPYQIKTDAKDVLVLGAGGGLDVEAALLSGAQHVDAVEIDRAIVGISRIFSPVDIYADPRVAVHIDDARAFLQRADKQYDAVVFGFLDSQNLFSYGTNLRLDGYIYTVECFQRAFQLVRDGGLMSVSFSVPRPWVAQKLARMLQQATKTTPLVYQLENRQYVLLVPKFSIENAPASIQMFQQEPIEPMLQASLPVATDNWPYLYLSKPGIPADYLIVIGALLIISIAGVLALRGTAGRQKEERETSELLPFTFSLLPSIDLLDAHFFFLGWGFLLLQTKSIGDCSLYFGTTWVVSLIVICGTLLMVLAANLVAMRIRGQGSGVRGQEEAPTDPFLLTPDPSLRPYAPLLATVILLILVPRHIVLGWDFPLRLAWAILIVPLPIFFAGLVFSTTFRQAAHPAACFGANLIGATIGGFCEYLGMWIGTAALSFIIIAVYLASFIALRLNRRAAIPTSLTPP